MGELGGVKDPNRHDDAKLSAFLSQFGQAPAGRPARAAPRPQLDKFQRPMMSAQVPYFAGGGMGMMGGKGMGMDMGMGMGMGMPMGGEGDMAGFIKLGQKQSAAFKESWRTYCAMYGGGVNDPSRHDPTYILGFIDYLGQLAQADLGAAAMQAGFSMPSNVPQPRMGGKRSMDAGFGGPVGGPPQKRQKAAGMPGGGDSDTAGLVEKVKALQRRDPELKQAWWAFTDESHGGVHDPNRHEVETLQEFLSQYE